MSMLFAILVAVGSLFLLALAAGLGRKLIGDA